MLLVSYDITELKAQLEWRENSQSTVIQCKSSQTFGFIHFNYTSGFLWEMGLISPDWQYSNHASNFILFRIVEAINNIVESLVIGPKGKLETVKRNFDIKLQAVKPQNFNGLDFSGIVRGPDKLEKSSISRKLGDSVSPSLYPSLIVPQSIFKETVGNNSFANQTVIFVLYKDTKFFRVSSADSTKMSHRLNSLVISGGIKGLSVTNLSVSVHIALPMIELGDTKSTQCSYWDFSLGNWSQEGCKFERVLQDGRVLCSCDHFTNFAMLMVRLLSIHYANYIDFKKIMKPTFTNGDQNGYL